MAMRENIGKTSGAIAFIACYMGLNYSLALVLTELVPPGKAIHRSSSSLKPGQPPGTLQLNALVSSQPKMPAMQE